VEGVIQGHANVDLSISVHLRNLRGTNSHPGVLLEEKPTGIHQQSTVEAKVVFDPALVHRLGQGGLLEKLIGVH
jgi:hypothetical protein